MMLKFVEYEYALFYVLASSVSNIPENAPARFVESLMWFVGSSLECFE